MTVKELVLAFGGTSSLARLLGVGPSLVSNWIAAETIPLKWLYPLMRHAEIWGIQVPDRFWDQFWDAAPVTPAPAKSGRQPTDGKAA